MAYRKQPKPVHQLTAAQFEKMFPGRRSLQGLLRRAIAGRKAFAARVVAILPFTIFLRANGIGSANNAHQTVTASPTSPGRFSKTRINRFAIGIASSILMLDQQEGHERSANLSLYGLRFV